MLGLLVLLLAAAAVCARLGAWQLDRARGEAAPEPRPPVPVTEVLEPQTTFPGSLVGREVAASGTFGEEQLLVPGRALEGRTGYLVLNPFTVEATGAVLPVVRGWVAEPRAPGPPPGTVTVVGALAAGEGGGEPAAEEGQVTAVSPADLVNRWGGPIYTGYLVLADAPTGVETLPAPSPETGFDLRNLGYALQWWVFGGFAVALWVRIVRDEVRHEEGAALSAPGDGGAAP